ncbi:hypothetical protein ACJX0J_014107, partial [Zea mays]
QSLSKLYFITISYREQDGELAEDNGCIMAQQQPFHVLFPVTNNFDYYFFEYTFFLYTETVDQKNDLFLINVHSYQSMILPGFSRLRKFNEKLIAVQPHLNYTLAGGRKSEHSKSPIHLMESSKIDLDLAGAK